MSPEYKKAQLPLEQILTTAILEALFQGEPWIRVCSETLHLRQISSCCCWAAGSGSCPLPAQGLQGMQTFWRAGIGQGGHQGCPKSCSALSAGQQKQALNSLWLAMGSLEKFPLPVDQSRTNNFSLLYTELLVWLWFCLQQGRGSGSSTPSALTLVCSIQHPRCEYYRISSSADQRGHCSKPSCKTFNEMRKRCLWHWVKQSSSAEHLNLYGRFWMKRWDLRSLHVWNICGSTAWPVGTRWLHLL